MKKLSKTLFLSTLVLLARNSFAQYMKAIIWLGLFFIFSFPKTIFGQRKVLTPIEQAQIANNYFDAFNTLNKKYNCNAPLRKNNQFVDRNSLDSSFRGIFGTVILNNDDLVNNGTAISITQDKEKSVFSFNYAFLKKNLKNAFNIGLYGSSTGTVFDFYSGKNWQKGAGVNLGWTSLSTSNSRTFEPKACQTLIEKRNFFITSKLQEYLETIKLDIATLKKRDSVLKSKLDFSSQVSASNITYTSKTYKDDLDEYNKIQLQLRQYDSLVTNDMSLVYTTKIARLSLIAFDNKNAEFMGYKVKWFSLNTNFGFGTNKIYIDTLKTNDSLLHFYTKDFLRIKLNLSANLASYQKRYLYFANLSCGIFNTNFLENRHITDIPILRYDDKLKKIVIRDNQDQNLGSLAEYKKTVWAVNPGCYIAWFPLLKKVIGFEFNGNYVAYFNKPKDVAMQNIFTSTLGILLRVPSSKDPMPKATVGLIVGLVNAEENSRVWRQSFSGQLKLGVPFNVLFSKGDK